MALASVHALMQALPQVLVIVNAQDAALTLLLQQQQVPHLAIHSDGLGESLAAGVRAQPEARGWVVALADMPFVRPSTIVQVHQSLREGASIVAPTYRGQRGHPVGFGHHHKTALLNLRGDEGAKAILKAHARELHLVDTDDPGVVHDIDTLSDLPATNR